ncbi:serine/threonine-protein phosphatase [bacterium]|nr:serine/threonine-protein phosphatase [bacterium]
MNNDLEIFNLKRRYEVIVRLLNETSDVPTATQVERSELYLKSLSFLAKMGVFALYVRDKCEVVCGVDDFSIRSGLHRLRDQDFFQVRVANGFFFGFSSKGLRLIVISHAAVENSFIEFIKARLGWLALLEERFYYEDNLDNATKELMFEKERAAVHEMELKTAHAVQEGLFPSAKFESSNGLSSCYYFCSASKCAGDWWGRVTVDPGKELVVIGDAVGHGVPAALLAAQAFAYFVSAPNINSFKRSDNEPNPAALVEGFSDVLWRSGRGRSTMTSFAALFDLQKMTLRYSNAGHPPPLHLSQEVVGRPRPLVGCGPLPGFSPGASAENVELTIQAEDRFLFYTDGLIEAQDPEENMFGLARLRRIFQTTMELNLENAVDAIVSALSEFTKGTPFPDDVTFLVIEVDRNPPTDAASSS